MNWLLKLSVGVVLGYISTIGTALGAGYWNPGQPVSNYARGGAHIAATGDPSAVFLNPAALAGLDGFQFIVGADLNHDMRAFDATWADEGGHDKGKAANQYSLARLPTPNMFFSYRLDTPGLVLGLGLWGPPRTDQVYEDATGAEFLPEGDQRYSAVTSRNLEVHTALSLAWEAPWKKLRVGLTGGFVHMTLDISLSQNVHSLGSEGDSDYDVYGLVQASHYWIPSGGFGASIEPLSGWTLAVSGQFAFDIEAAGTLELKLGPGIEGTAQINGKDIRLLAKMPGILRVASAYDFAAHKLPLELEVAFVYENWSRNRVANIFPQGITTEIPGLQDKEPLAPIEIPNHFRDAYSIRLGGTYEVSEDLLALSAGVFYETGAVLDTYLNALAHDLDKLGVGLGGKLKLGAGLSAYLTGGYIQWFERKVTTSEVRLVDPLNTKKGELGIADGTYTGSQIVMMAGVSGHYDI
ncbi:MAG: outer membrane protein transport protein [Myxococcota bacterium]|nr:outer membrane protein transport protein [Myxococcota bacterium]